MVFSCYFPSTYNGGRKSKKMCCVLFSKFCQNSILLLHLVNFSHHGAVGSGEPVLMRYIFGGKYPGAKTRDWNKTSHANGNSVCVVMNKSLYRQARDVAEVFENFDQKFEMCGIKQAHSRWPTRQVR